MIILLIIKIINENMVISLFKLTRMESAMLDKKNPMGLDGFEFLHLWTQIHLPKI